MWGCRFFLQRHPGHAKGKFYIVIPDIFYRESILFFPSQQPLIEWNEAHAFILNTMSTKFCAMPGFAPADDLLLGASRRAQPLFWRQK